MNNLTRLTLELNNKNYFENSQEIYEQILAEHALDPLDEYEAANDRISLLESVYSILQMLSNDIDNYCKVETEFITKTAAYAYLQKRLSDIRKEIDRVKDETGTADKITSYMFFNGVQ